MRERVCNVCVWGDGGWEVHPCCSAALIVASASGNIHKTKGQVLYTTYQL